MAPKQQMRTRGCLAYPLKGSEASTTFSCLGNLARRESPGLLLQVFPRSPSFFIKTALLAEARRRFFLNGGRRCQRVHPCPPRSQALKEFPSLRRNPPIHRARERPGRAHPRVCPAALQAFKANLRPLLHVRIWRLKIRVVWINTNLSREALFHQRFLLARDTDLIDSAAWW